ncbi:MAG: CvpA family protein [Desulfovibrio sp.]|nr:CvpA family protein [Desulfovibrio sp.]
MDLNILDAGLGIVLFLFLARGLLRGMSREAGGLAGLALGFWAAGRFHDQLAPRLRGLIADEATAAAAAYAALFIASFLLVACLAVLLSKLLTLTFSPWLDHLMGGVLGTAKGLLLCALAMALLERLAPESPFLRESLVARQITDLTDLVTTYLPAFL